MFFFLSFNFTLVLFIIVKVLTINLYLSIEQYYIITLKFTLVYKLHHKEVINALNFHDKETELPWKR